MVEHPEGITPVPPPPPRNYDFLVSNALQTGAFPKTHRKQYRGPKETETNPTVTFLAIHWPNRWHCRILLYRQHGAHADTPIVYKIRADRGMNSWVVFHYFVSEEMTFIWKGFACSDMRLCVWLSRLNSCLSLSDCSNRPQNTNGDHNWEYIAVSWKCIKEWKAY